MRVFLSLAVLLPLWVAAQGHDGHRDGMRMSESGIVMNENVDRLPAGCDAISTEHEFTIYGGDEYADEFPGHSFGMSQPEVHVEPCSRVTVTFVNEDEIRHQWMVHGLPKYLYPAGMFHVEAMGGQQQTGTFIVPAEDKNYLIHCDMAQHMEKGMRGQLVVGTGSGDLWSVAGVSDAFHRSNYLPAGMLMMAALAALAAFLLAWKIHS